MGDSLGPARGALADPLVDHDALKSLLAKKDLELDQELKRSAKLVSALTDGQYNSVRETLALMAEGEGSNHEVYMNCEPWGKENAYKFVFGGGYMPSMIVSNGRIISGGQLAGELNTAPK